MRRRRIWLKAGLGIAAGALGLVGGRDATPASRPDAAAPFRSAADRARYLEAYAAWSAEWPLAADERMIETSFGATFARGSGPVGAPVALLLPGARSTSLVWSANVAALAATQRVWAIDSVADFGRSIPARAMQDASDFDRWLHEVGRALSPDRPFALGGVSFGAWLAARYALAQPTRIRALAIVAPAGVVVRPRFSFLTRATLAMLLPSRFGRSFLTWLLHDLATGDAAGRALLERRIAQARLAAESFQPRWPLPPELLSDAELRALPLPTLVILGANERMFSPEAALARLRKVAPGIEAALVAGAGHDVASVQSETVNTRLAEVFGRGLE